MLPALLTELSADTGNWLLLRACCAAVVALLLVLLGGPRAIRWLQGSFREPNVSDSARLNELHAHKNLTPTMGGLFLIAAMLTATLLWSRWANAYLLIALLLTAGLTALGACDDLRKLRTGRRGLSARAKFAGQLCIALVIALLLFHQLGTVPGGLELAIPFTSFHCSLGAWFVPLAMVVLVGSSNAVNLTDGLDGLAGGCLFCSTLGMLALAYLAGQQDLAARWGITHLRGASEVVVLGGAMLGALLGFLRFNCYPAKVFMGDTGSLPLGGLLGFFALASRQELLLVVIGGVFVAEALSVVLQVGIFKWKRVRLFRCAPLHHHFQFLGWNEQRIVGWFWLASVGCLILGFLGKVSGTFLSEFGKGS